MLCFRVFFEESLGKTRSCRSFKPPDEQSSYLFSRDDKGAIYEFKLRKLRQKANLACVAGVRRGGKGKERAREGCSILRAHFDPFPPLLRPATRAKTNHDAETNNSDVEKSKNRRKQNF